MNTNAYFVPGAALQRFCLILWILIWAGHLPAQNTDTGAISGRVVDTWQGGPVAGVTVIVRGTTLGTTTDSTGSYTVDKVPPGTYTVVLSRSGYARATIAEVRVVAGQKTPADFALKPEFYEMEAFEAVSEPMLDGVTAVFEMKQEARVVMDVMGADMISRSGAGDVGEILTKVSGAAIVDGKFAVIRGLSDRYTSSTLNGAEIPSADPYRKSAQLDLFPSSMVERVEVRKTFSPELAGGFTGGTINIVTKSFPEKFTFELSAGVGYNSQANMRDDFLHYDGGRTDWLGIDDGTRAQPSLLDDVDTFPNPNSGPVGTRQARADQLDAITRSFKNGVMGPTPSSSPLDSSYSLSFGDTLKIKDRRFGYFASLSYERDYEYYADGGGARYNVVGVTPSVFSFYSDERGVEETVWASVVNLAYEFSEGNEISFNFLYTQNTDDRARRQIGKTDQLSQVSDPSNTSEVDLNTLHYTERHLENYQIAGKHLLDEATGVKANWLVSLATTTQDEPDLRYFNFLRTPDPSDPTGQTYTMEIGDNNVPAPWWPTRFFRSLTENNLNVKTDFEVPFEWSSGLENAVKFGLFWSRSEREFNERTFTYKGTRTFTGDPDDFANWFLDPSRFGYTRIGNTYLFDLFLDNEFGDNKYTGRQEIHAAYLMSDLAVSSRLKLSGGYRYEQTAMDIESTAYRTTAIIRGDLDAKDWLPALNVTYTLVTNMNLRFGYSETIARPTYRELARYRSADLQGDEIIEGNSDLKRTYVNNLDVRWEWYPNPGDLISVSLFQKFLADPIERVAQNSTGDVVTFTNSPSGMVYGLELELRKNLGFIDPLLRDLTVGMNFAWIESEVENPANIVAQKQVAFPGQDHSTRRLYDQSPYVLNADITYANPELGTTLSLIFNEAGERLVTVIPLGYDIYEQPAPQLDLIVSQRLYKNWRIKFAARNLLNPDFKRVLGREGELENRPVYSTYSKGISYSVSLSYSF